MANTYTLISAQTLASPAASVTFSAIPATYTDLVLRVSARSDDAAVTRTLTVAVNGSTALTSFTYINGVSTTASSSYAVFNDNVQLTGALDADNATSSTFNNAEIYIPNYTSTGSKPMSGIGVAETNSATTAQITAVAGLYRTTTAVSSITISLNTFATNFFKATSSFYLYGIKNS
jgi:hypothetical protein